jgi:transposase-like protein
MDVTLALVLTAFNSKERSMPFITVQCPHCLSEQIVKRGKTRRGTQRSLCQKPACTQGSFLLDSSNRGCLPAVKHQIIDRSLNASGMRDTARVLRISTDTALRELRKQDAALESVNSAPCSAR